MKPSKKTKELFEKEMDKAITDYKADVSRQVEEFFSRDFGGIAALLDEGEG